MRTTPMLTDMQVQTLMHALRGHPLEALIQLALATGLRRDELLNLKWEGVDLEGHRLSFENAKTGNPACVHLTDEIATLLEQHHVAQLEAQAQAGLTWANHDLVFPDRHGEPIRPHQLIVSFHEVAGQAGLPDIRWSDLRATYQKHVLDQLRETHRRAEER